MIDVLCLYAPLLLYGALLTLGVRRWSSLGSDQRLIPVFEGLCLVVTLGIELHKHLRIGPSPLSHAFLPVSTLLIAEIFARSMTNPLWQKGFRLVAVVNLATWVLWGPFQDLHSFAGPSFHVHTALKLLLPLACLAELSRDAETSLLERPVFWVAAGVLIEAAANLIHYPARDWLWDYRRDLFLLFVGIRAIVVIFTHLLFGMALLCPAQTPRYSR